MNNNEQEKHEDEPTKLRTTQYLIETIKHLEAEVQNLKLKLIKKKGIPSEKIGIAFLIPGVLSLIYSILKESQILAFIGLTLTFWGALFFFIKPVRYVKGNLLDSVASSSYITIDRIIKDLNFKGKSYYIPPYPKDAYLPEHLKGLKEMVVFISAYPESSMPPIEEMAKSKFMIKNPNGICISPPGLGILDQMEKELRTDTTNIDIETLIENLPSILTENLQLAKEIEMKKENSKIYLKITNSIYKKLYTKKQNLKSIHFLGCPLASAIACAIAKATGKAVTIHQNKVSAEGETMEFWYSFEES
jgi:hypothetical protein